MSEHGAWGMEQGVEIEGINQMCQFKYIAQGQDVFAFVNDHSVSKD